jgi:hypothetical protein
MGQDATAGFQARVIEQEVGEMKRGNKGGAAAPICGHHRGPRHHLVVTCALANLFMVRRHLLRWQQV